MVIAMLCSSLIVVAPAGAGGRFFEKKLRKKLFIGPLFEIGSNIANLRSCRYVSANSKKRALEKFFAELFFKKATTRARRRRYQ